MLMSCYCLFFYRKGAVANSTKKIKSVLFRRYFQSSNLRLVTGTVLFSFGVYSTVEVDCRMSVEMVNFLAITL